MKTFPILCLAYMAACCISCTNQQKLQIKNTLKQAETNAAALETVLRHYEEEDPDELKLEAARFLIANMNGHYSAQSNALERFQHKIHHYSDTVVLNMPVINRLWKEASEEGENNRISLYDAKTLSPEFLIDNIEKAFTTWQTSAWKSEVDFDTFCQYVLPYRFQNEVLPAIGWRDSLYNEYYPLVAGEKDIKRAFAILQAKVWSQVGSSSSEVPYIINILDLKRQRRATCVQRCVLLGSVLRSLGIPAAIDNNVTHWPNYSQTGHSWVAMVINDGTYTVYEKDSIARQYNPIDASSFKANKQALKDYPIDGLFKKRYARIGRATYALQVVPEELDWNWELIPKFVNPFRMDVSEAYGKTGTVSVASSFSTKYAYLCTFATGNDWEPIIYAKVQHGKCRFDNMGDSAVYLPVVYKEERMQPVEYPFLWMNRQKKYFIPDTIHRQTLVLTRKYPLTGNFLNSWTQFIGGKLEGSQYRDFKQKEVLATIASTPGFHTEIALKPTQAYRYFRFVAPDNCKVPIMEIECWDGEQRLSGSYFGEKTTHPWSCFDGDTFTTSGQIEEGYSVGVDFGKPQSLTHIIFYPKNDGNYVIPDNEYELFYYDMKWISLGRRSSKGYSLVYENAPSNAIFLLKNLTKGREGRIFSYENGIQVWY